MKWSRGSLSVGGLCNNMLRRTTEAQRFPAVRWQRSCNGQPDEQSECFNASGRARAVAGATVLAKSLACCLAMCAIWDETEYWVVGSARLCGSAQTYKKRAMAG
jgi:hypothetical protein